ncbi:2-C-methyl-D-erythritol 2,4-cyclodiphosphate synthase [Carboxylicivirga marina]|uniref:2-C-methyl-D-erythritol 2,4-cyclodiphosphate synthase n=1 Tax=Carboxylicivirga marina TaxID=2800988 RepID=A0ABS1HLS8_9BACT|nr:2-C-methyl-D-erythritol 2,4-cyclodiphosphate synthase [Carboxylicivirga marina]MBK3518415.1 2-C-methyl-D-erythritol 2,4-cyclodiphosphate synthase [Carboxylicivirga marina]
MKIKVGFGYDVHQLGEGEELWIGGIKVEHTKGSIGHSDGDVLIHAICDALLGAANMRDIGFHFPDTDPQLKGVDSKLLLDKTIGLIRKNGYDIGNIDSTIALEKPKLKGLIPEMQRVLAQVMDIDIEDIAIKATTTEKLGFVGEQKGIAAYATVLINKS